MPLNTPAISELDNKQNKLSSNVLSSSSHVINYKRKSIWTVIFQCICKVASTTTSWKLPLMWVRSNIQLPGCLSYMRCYADKVIMKVGQISTLSVKELIREVDAEEEDSNYVKKTSSNIEST